MEYIPEVEAGAVPGVEAVTRLVIGISGASGTVYAVRLLEQLHATGVETHLILTEAAKRVAQLELPGRLEEASQLADVIYADGDVAAAPASGTFPVDGMVVMPCSIKTLSAVANSYAEGLLARAADVTLKEHRRLVLVVRETPLHVGHLRLMVRAAEMGAVILPPVPGFYHRPRTIEDVVDHTVGRVLDQFSLAHQLYRPWSGASGIGADPDEPPGDSRPATEH